MTGGGPNLVAVESGSFAFFNKDLLSILEERLESTRFAKLLETMEETSISRRGLSLEGLLTDPVSPLSTFLREELPAAQRSLYIQCKSRFSPSQVHISLKLFRLFRRGISTIPISRPSCFRECREIERTGAAFSVGPCMGRNILHSAQHWHILRKTRVLRGF